MGYYASAHGDSEVQPSRAFGASFPKDASGSGEPAVQGKLVTIVEEEDEGVMLAAPGYFMG